MSGHGNNLGEANEGDRNAGSGNIGSRNAGDFNVGNFNAGSANIGDFNSGWGNTGNFNSGFFNLGNNNAGSFCIGDGWGGEYLFNRNVGWGTVQRLTRPCSYSPGFIVRMAQSYNPLRVEPIDTAMPSGGKRVVLKGGKEAWVDMFRDSHGEYSRFSLLFLLFTNQQKYTWFDKGIFYKITKLTETECEKYINKCGEGGGCWRS
jgi:hypothetical protein